ncbi:MAG: transporter substrate-binding domain-containing protein [Gammaproteobacteria bacterium]|jgi:polar amino acid transport system substrate-binding protein
MKKNQMFHFASSAVFLLLTTVTVNAAELKLVADEWPPFTSAQQGQRIAVDLVQTALQNAAVDTKVKILPWQEVLSGIKADKYDAIVAAWKTPEREQYLLFSRAYLENRIDLIGRQDNKIRFDNIEQLKGKKVGVVSGYAYGNEITNNKDIIQVPGATVADNIKKLLGGEVDFILADALVAQAIKEHLPPEITEKLYIYDKEVVTQGLYFAVRKNLQNAQPMLDKFNKAIEQMIADGTYNKILGFTWLVADSNSDGVYEYIAGGNLSSAGKDPAEFQAGYALFGDSADTIQTEENLPDMPSKKPLLKYRVLNQEYNSWDDAKQAIDQAREEGVSPYEDTSGTFDFLIGKF